VTARLAALSPRALVGLAAGVVLLWAVLLWLLYVSPQRSDASRLGNELSAARSELAQAEIAAHHHTKAASPVSDVFRMAKAMPRSSDQSSLVLELTRLARTSGVTLGSVASEPSTEGQGGTTMIPVTVTVNGRFRQITRFLQRTRSLVAVHGGRLSATGRLFTVESVELAQSAVGGFPRLDGTIVLDAYVYDGPITPVAPQSGDGSQQQTVPSGSTAAAGGTN
jgi:Tfp pilus assembly protein PilO